MGLTNQSCGSGAIKENFFKNQAPQIDYEIALAGNPQHRKKAQFLTP